MKILNLTLFCLMISFWGISQEVPQSLSLQEAIDYALKNNRTSKNGPFVENVAQINVKRMIDKIANENPIQLLLVSFSL